MSDLVVHQFQFEGAALEKMSEQQINGLLMLGLLSNEVNWLQKLLIMGMADPDLDSPPEVEAKNSLSVMLVKLLAGKMHAGGERFRDKELAVLLARLNISPRGRACEQAISQALSANSTIHRIRRGHAFHYPNSLKLPKAIPGNEKLSFYATVHSGDTLCAMSDIATIEAMVLPDALATKGWQAAFEDVLNEVVEAAGNYNLFLSEVLAAIVQELPANERLDVVIKGAAPLDAVRPTFFALPIEPAVSDDAK